MGHKLVADSEEAIEAAHILGARTLVPIHYALKPIPLLVQTRSSERDLLSLAKDVPNLNIICLQTGEKWPYALRKDPIPSQERD